MYCTYLGCCMEKFEKLTVIAGVSAYCDRTAATIRPSGITHDSLTLYHCYDNAISVTERKGLSEYRHDGYLEISLFTVVRERS